jgi:DNA repair exonuclease SbcCD nuclease subunit
MDKGMMCHDGMSAELFDRFELVMSGHFHHRSKNGPIQYLGNTYEITWADYDDTRGFHIFDTDTRNLTFVPNPYKMFYKLQYDDTIQNFEHWNSLDFSSYKDTCVKVVVKQKTNPYLFDSVLDKLYASSPLDVSIVENYLTISESFEDAVIDQAEDTMTILRSYIDGLKMDVDPNQLKEFMGQLYQDALAAERSL